MPNAASDGPRTIRAIVFGVEPPMTKPPISTSPPVPMNARVEMFRRRGGFGSMARPVTTTPPGKLPRSVEAPVERLMR
jgi:hypothetical protein